EEEEAEVEVETIPESLSLVPPLVAEEEATVKPVTPKDTETELRFPDVPLDYWAYPFIEKVAEEDIIKGAEDGNFYPDKPVTREEFAIQLSRAFGDDSEAIAEVQFKDVTTQNDSFTQIAKSVKTGFLKGYPQDTFRPKQEIPRYQVLVALASGFALQPPSAPAQTLDIFQDKNQLPQWATNQVAAATENGLVVNHPEPNLLKPEQVATRAEVAAMIYQALVEAGKAEAIASPYVISPQEAN
ncbi:MAG: S-layer homology domain-containing protein, partial [Spirulinaceae cyanobacterium]